MEPNYFIRDGMSFDLNIPDTTVIELDTTKFNEEKLQLCWYYFRTHNNIAITNYSKNDYAKKMIEDNGEKNVTKWINQNLNIYSAVEKYFILMMNKEFKICCLKIIPESYSKKTISFTKIEDDEPQF